MIWSYGTQSSMENTCSESQFEYNFQNIGKKSIQNIQIKHQKPGIMMKKINFLQKKKNFNNKTLTSRTLKIKDKTIFQDKTIRNSQETSYLSSRAHLLTQLKTKQKKKDMNSPIVKIKQRLNKILLDGLQVKKMTSNIINSTKQTNKRIKKQFQDMGQQYDLPQIKKVRQQKRLLYLQQMRKIEDWMISGLYFGQTGRQNLRTVKSLKSFKSFKHLKNYGISGLISSKKLCPYQF